LGEQLVPGVRPAVGAAVDEPRNRLDAGRDEYVTLPGLDRVKRHPRRLQRRRAVPVDRRAGQEVVAELDRDGTGDVEAGLTARLPAAHHQVVDVVRVELWHLVERCPDDLRGQIVRTDADQRALGRTSDG